METIDELLAAFSPEFISDIEKFIMDNIQDINKQKKIVELINRAFVEGTTDITTKSRLELAKQAMEFQKYFEKQLLNGKNNSDSK